MALLAAGVAFAQAIVGVRVLTRLIGTAGGKRIVTVPRAPSYDGTVSAIVPVLNERARLAPCLDGLISQGPELREIVVVDGGSQDGTQELVAGYRQRDARVRLVDASPVPEDWNGKAWGLAFGAKQVDAAASWLLTVDADVRPEAPLVPSLLTHADLNGLRVLSVATEQELASGGMALVHPALLTTLVYRFGIPGHATRQPRAVQANGQCMLVRRDLLERVGGFAAVRGSICEDVTLARLLAADGWAVGFYEGDGLVSTRMYESGWETFANWPRSLPLRDHLAGRSALVGLAEVTLAQALPLAVVAAILAGQGKPHPHRASDARCLSGLFAVNAILLAVRLGVLAGTARAYRQPSPLYWFSPLFDLPAIVQLWRSALAREHRWRGRTIVTGGAA